MSHHANLYISPTLDNKVLPNEVQEVELEVEHLKFEQFGIDEARALKQTASLTAFGAKLRQFVLITRKLTIEAQNALLKLFEEPPPATKFHLLVPSENILIPTLRSRLFFHEIKFANPTNKEFTDFLTLDFGERIAKIADRLKAKDVQWQKSIHEGLMAYAKVTKKTSHKPVLELVIRYFDQRGSSKKCCLNTWQ